MTGSEPRASSASAPTTAGREHVYRLDEERERLATLAEEVESLIADADDADARRAAEHELNEIGQQGAAVACLIDEYGADAEVVVRGLTAGEFGRVEDRVAAARASRDDAAPLEGYHRVVYAAAGLVDAPFVAADDLEATTERERLDAKIEVVQGLDIGTVKWLYSRVDDATTPDAGNWRSSDGDA